MWNLESNTLHNEINLTSWDPSTSKLKAWYNLFDMQVITERKINHNSMRCKRSLTMYSKMRNTSLFSLITSFNFMIFGWFNLRRTWAKQFYLYQWQQQEGYIYCQFTKCENSYKDAYGTTILNHAKRPWAYLNLS